MVLLLATDAAHPAERALATGDWLPIRVLGRVLMAVDTVRLVDQGATDVLRMRHGLKVIRVHAARDPTQVIELKTDGYVGDQRHVRQPMREAFEPTTGEARVPLAVQRVCPYPTGRQMRAVFLGSAFPEDVRQHHLSHSLDP